MVIVVRRVRRGQVSVSVSDDLIEGVPGSPARGRSGMDIVGCDAAYVRAGRGISLGSGALRDNVRGCARWNGAGLADVGGQIVASGDDIAARGASQDPQ